MVEGGAGSFLKGRVYIHACHPSFLYEFSGSMVYQTIFVVRYSISMT